MNAPLQLNHNPPKTADISAWRDFALLTQKITSGQSRAFTQLRTMEIALRKVAVLGTLNSDNPCIRLMDVARKASFSSVPAQHFATLTAYSAAVLDMVEAHEKAVRHG